VYLSASKTMPGFVQLDTCAEDPRNRNWALQTMSGVTRFQCVYAVPTGNAEGLARRFRQVLTEDEVPHHEELFHMPIRFARQILQDEARAFPGGPEPVTPAWRRPALTAGMLLAVLVSSLGLTPRVASPVQVKAVAQPVLESVEAVAVPAPAPMERPPMPKFRL
jgi:hypothetical protein